MDKVLYDLMDWAAIEELVYSEAAEPKNMLGAHVTEAGVLVQAFIPGAAAVTVKLAANGEEYPMELQDDAGFLRCWFRGRKLWGIRCWLPAGMIRPRRSMIHTPIRHSIPTVI